MSSGRRGLSGFHWFLGFYTLSMAGFLATAATSDSTVGRVVAGVGALSMTALLIANLLDRAWLDARNPDAE